MMILRVHRHMRRKAARIGRWPLGGLADVEEELGEVVGFFRSPAYPAVEGDTGGRPREGGCRGDFFADDLPSKGPKGRFDVCFSRLNFAIRMVYILSMYRF
jgi:hypothetical protein